MSSTNIAHVMSQFVYDCKCCKSSILETTRPFRNLTRDGEDLGNDYCIQPDGYSSGKNSRTLPAMRYGDQNTESLSVLFCRSSYLFVYLGFFSDSFYLNLSF